MSRKKQERAMCAARGDGALVEARKARTSRRRGGRLARPAVVAWSPFRPVIGDKRDPAAIQTLANSRYRVSVYNFPWSGMSTADGKDVLMTRLAISRQDLGPVRDWMDLQRIKTEICGEESEAIELFPAESRRVDYSSNQCHLWVLPPGVAWPVGFAAETEVSP